MMKMLGLASLGVLFLAGVVSAGPGSYAGEVMASRLQLRAGPGESYQTVAILEKGSRFIVLGPHANAPAWLRVQIPGGFEAWVFGRFVKRDAASGMGTVTTDRVLLRPRPTTRYHHLVGRLDKGEQVKVVGEKQTPEGIWYRIVAPPRFPLFTHKEFVKNAGDVSLAKAAPPATARAAGEQAPAVRPPAGSGTGVGAEVLVGRNDSTFDRLAADVRVKLTAATASPQIGGLRNSVAGFDPATLSPSRQEQRLRLLSELVQAERAAARSEFEKTEQRVLAELEKKLALIQREYERKLREIQNEAKRQRRPRYTAIGLVAYRPDILGRYPSYRLEEGGKMRYYLIAENYELSRFNGKRVGVVGLKDPESGTGFESVIVKRIEIIGEK